MPTTTERIADARAKLAGDVDVWVATGDSKAVTHLVPLSLCWRADEVVIASETAGLTARNAAASGQPRPALDSTRDVVSIETAATVVARTDAGATLVEAYQARTGWDPGSEGGEWVFLRCTPVSVQVWRTMEEIAGRTVMRRGAWLR
ncbi:MAG: pyridoxamine 5'-phosphate oxidase [Actinomycetota bacterium]|nr:pyridoxamine 5'-phosphate oxidase [Actinomycetota bacterium]